MELKEIAKRNYAATVRRGLITEKTNFIDFYYKISEELEELGRSFGYSILDFDEKELADIVLVCFAMAEHFEIDLLKEMEKKMIYNEVRK